jgi:ATP-binding cassette subfamily B protein
VVGTVISRMVLQFQMQVRIDRMNEVLRSRSRDAVVRAFVREPRKWIGSRRQRRPHRDIAQHGSVMAFMFPSVMLVVNLSSVAAVWIGGNRINAGSMQIGALVAFLSYLIQILMSVMMASFVGVMTPRAAVSAERIEEVLDAASSIVPPEVPITELPEASSLEFRNVEFRYPGAEHAVLSNITFTARAGETTAIIGSTGSGKSTLLNLVPRMFDVTAGSVL